MQNMYSVTKKSPNSWYRRIFLSSVTIIVRCRFNLALSSTHLILINSTVGHGLSCGDQVQIDSIDQYVDDIIKHVSLVKEAFPRLPLFAVAHSMVNLWGFFSHPAILNMKQISRCLIYYYWIKKNLQMIVHV